MAEKLRADMSVEEVARAVGATTAMFQITSVNATHGNGNSAGRAARDGDGSMQGVTLTEPPFEWSIRAESGMHERAPRQILTPEDLMAPGMSIDSFILRQLYK